MATPVEQWVDEVTHHTFLHENVKTFIDGFHYDAHPMGILVSTLGALSTFYRAAKQVHDPEMRALQRTRLIAKTPTVAAFAYRHAVGLPYVYPDNDLNYAGNFLNMMWKTTELKYRPDPILERALEVLFILHADHEQNCSTSTVRMVGSSGANRFASIAAGLCALWGPLHGGANQEVIQMLKQIRDDGGDYRKYVAMAKDKASGFRLMGFGHRVYKNFDPRATIIKKSCFEVLNKLGVKNKLLEIAVELEDMALKDEYFVQRRLYPNVDFYSGIIYQAIGFPVDMFTVLFALGRLPGWIPQWRELAATREALPMGQPVVEDLRRGARY